MVHTWKEDSFCQNYWYVHERKQFGPVKWCVHEKNQLCFLFKDLSIVLTKAAFFSWANHLNIKSEMRSFSPIMPSFQGRITLLLINVAFFLWLHHLLLVSSPVMPTYISEKCWLHFMDISLNFWPTETNFLTITIEEFFPWTHHLNCFWWTYIRLMPPFYIHH